MKPLLLPYIFNIVVLIPVGLRARKKLIVTNEEETV